MLGKSQFYIIVSILICFSAYAEEKLPLGTIKKGSLSNQKLISDTKVGVAAKVATLGCNNLNDFEPYVVANPKGKPGAQFWKERWIVNGCGKKFPVNIRFSEDGLGGAFWTIEN